MVQESVHESENQFHFVVVVVVVLVLDLLFGGGGACGFLTYAAIYRRHP